MIVIESQYFPPIEYFALLNAQKEIIIDGHENFVKQTYRNRCKVLASNGILSLSIPLKGVGKKITTGKMEIDYGQKWLNNHWRAILSGYNKSPFFEYYEDTLHDIMFTKHQYLIDLNKHILTFCLKALNIDKVVQYSDHYMDGAKEPFKDYRSYIHPKTSYASRNIYAAHRYGQVFGSKFVENLSILDLLFCEGPKSKDYF